MVQPDRLAKIYIAASDTDQYGFPPESLAQLYCPILGNPAALGMAISEASRYVLRVVCGPRLERKIEECPALIDDCQRFELDTTLGKAEAIVKLFSDVPTIEAYANRPK